MIYLFFALCVTLYALLVTCVMAFPLLSVLDKSNKYKYLIRNLVPVSADKLSHRALFYTYMVVLVVDLPVCIGILY